MAGKVNTSIAIDPGIYKRAKRLAQLELRNFSSFVEYTLWLRIKQHDADEAAAKAADRIKSLAEAKTLAEVEAEAARKSKPPAPVKTRAKTTPKTGITKAKDKTQVKKK